uniref:Uncharacterized protein n=1 Tax=Gopherus agassizii TaxID=38772 RepID=A0A452IB90_9SAUR
MFNSPQIMQSPVGAGQEVGRSCIILEFKGRKIMVIICKHLNYKGLW